MLACSSGVLLSPINSVRFHMQAMDVADIASRPRFPLEPPSLACPTPQGRAVAAEGERASLWWARASPLILIAPKTA